jgi:hypothetical protein
MEQIMRHNISFRTMCLELVVGITLLMARTGYGADAERNYRVYGGLGSCNMYLNVMSGKTAMNVDRQYYIKWIEGYLTAVNLKTSDTYDIFGKLDIDGAVGWLKNYCNDNPHRSLSYAIDALVDELYPHRITKEPADTMKR